VQQSQRNKGKRSKDAENNSVLTSAGSTDKKTHKVHSVSIQAKTDAKIHTFHTMPQRLH